MLPRKHHSVAGSSTYHLEWSNCTWHLCRSTCFFCISSMRPFELKVVAPMWVDQWHKTHVIDVFSSASGSPFSALGNGAKRMWMHLLSFLFTKPKHTYPRTWSLRVEISAVTTSSSPPLLPLCVWRKAMGVWVRGIIQCLSQLLSTSLFWGWTWFAN